MRKTKVTGIGGNCPDTPSQDQSTASSSGTTRTPREERVERRLVVRENERSRRANGLLSPAHVRRRQRPVPKVEGGTEQRSPSPVRVLRGSTPIDPEPTVLYLTGDNVNTISRNSGSMTNTAGDEIVEMRCIVTRVEAECIGIDGMALKDGSWVSGIVTTISDSQKGAGERILTLRGNALLVSQRFGQLVKGLGRLHNKDSEVQTSALRLLIPEALLRNFIQNNSKMVREIEGASSARLTISAKSLPMSTERLFCVQGVPDAVHIATYYITTIIITKLLDRFGDTNALAYSTVSGRPAAPLVNKLLVIPYIPQALCGSYGNPATQKHILKASPGSPTNALESVQSFQARMHVATNNAMHAWTMGRNYTPAAGVENYASYTGFPQAPTTYGQAMAPTPTTQHTKWSMVNDEGPNGVRTQWIHIPNEMVGAIIGKGGARINELRQVSGSYIKIGPESGEPQRELSITGSAENNALALAMLQQRLESESRRY